MSTVTPTTMRTTPHTFGTKKLCLRSGPATFPSIGGCVQQIGRHDNKEIQVVVT